ncbi:hypothetical protein PDE_05813 [Penicillium oxalicum 114-2]|uniref:Uncharacterized protein n=1 Tax=Penicillium oxalicum (strain 114-2 / CGMCC 5302) TaxID=933388 RepID=S7ZQG1_PENO1|nr:hypothetical protein PDE_05813 [Penicillium oxalicum 114-2]
MLYISLSVFPIDTFTALIKGFCYNVLLPYFARAYTISPVR